MSQSLDDKIRMRLIEQDIDVPEECSNKIEQTIAGLSEKNVKKGFMHYKAVIAVASLCILVSTITTTFAAVNYVRQRMKNLSEEEKDSYNQGLQNSTANADSYTRDMTDSEKDRMKELRAEYEKGTFPVKALTVVHTQTDADGKSEVYFVEDTSLFVLPSRELTDEEMLEIIDFYYKRDYSLMEKTDQEAINRKTAETVTESPEEFTESGGLDEDSAKELAKTTIANIYGTDCSEFDITIDYDTNDYGHLYYIDLKDDINSTVYSVVIDADNRQVSNVNYFPEKDNIASGIKVDEDEFIAKYKDALDILTNKMAIDLTIEASTCEYNKNSEGCLPYGIVNYLFKMEDGTGYVLQYSCTNDAFFNIFITDYDKYRELMQQTINKKKEQGIERIIVQMQ